MSSPQVFPEIDAVSVDRLSTLKRSFESSNVNKLIQNSLCSNHLEFVTEVRNYMQSRDSEFSHILEPELIVSNQGLSGRCWMFAVLNVIRHEMVRKFNLVHDFELSESYLCFYEKLEKCNFVLTKIAKMDKLDCDDRYTVGLLCGGCQDGGLWVTCSNLIKKYGVIPKTCFKESINSFNTDTMNEVLDAKLKEFALMLTSEANFDKRQDMKNDMMRQIYEILCKMLGTPPNPNEKFDWSFIMNMDLTEQIDRETKRRKTGEYENLQIKNIASVTPLEFYKFFVVNNLDEYVKLGNDPRHPYYKYYEGYDDDVVIGGEKNGFFNVPMEVITEACKKSIMDNTPVEFDCDVCKFLNHAEELMDIKAYDYDLVFEGGLNNMSKKEGLMSYGTYPAHAMVLVGVDINDDENVTKWKVENSWGRHEGENSTGYYVMSHDWFDKYTFNVVVHRKYIPRKLSRQYDAAKNNVQTLPLFDIMG
jgi:bleomycin hydrolase